MIFLDPGTLAALGCESYAFLSNSFATVLLQSVSNITLMSCCQIPSRGGLSAGGLGWFSSSRSPGTAGSVSERAHAFLVTLLCFRRLCIYADIVRADCEERQDNMYIVICKNY